MHSINLWRRSSRSAAVASGPSGSNTSKIRVAGRCRSSVPRSASRATRGAMNAASELTRPDFEGGTAPVGATKAYERPPSRRDARTGVMPVHTFDAERAPVISAALIVMLAALTGWLAGLTAHAFRATRWQDPGARVVWGVGAGIGAGGALLMSLALCLLTRPAVFLLAIPASLTVGALGAWRANEMLREPRPAQAPLIEQHRLGRAHLSAPRRSRLAHLVRDRRAGRSSSASEAPVRTPAGKDRIDAPPGRRGA